MVIQSELQTEYVFGCKVGYFVSVLDAYFEIYIWSSFWIFLIGNIDGCNDGDIDWMSYCNL